MSKRKIIQKTPWEFRAYEKCLYRESVKDAWLTTTFYYADFEEHSYIVNSNVKYKYLLPFEGNENLLFKVSKGEEGDFPVGCKIPKEFEHVCNQEKITYLHRAFKTLQEISYQE